LTIGVAKMVQPVLSKFSVASEFLDSADFSISAAFFSQQGVRRA
jgi:hypothetical protein